MSKESIKMTPGDDTHLTLLMAPVSLNFMTGQDREHLLAYGRAAFEAGQKCQGCDVPKDGVYQISEPMPADKRALMLSATASEPFKSQLKECAARIAELESQLAAAQQGVPEGWKLVPVEPQDAQQAAGATAIRFDTTLINKMWTANKVYREMVAAAPQSPAAQPTTQGLDAQIIQALSAGMSIEQWQSSVDVRIGSSDLLGRAIASGEETRIELVRRAVSEVFAAQAKQGGA